MDSDDRNLLTWVVNNAVQKLRSNGALSTDTYTSPLRSMRCGERTR